jgi:hypothetical protein
MAIARFGRADMAQTARQVGDILAEDRKKWKQEVLSGASRPHDYATTQDVISCLLHPHGPGVRLEVLGGLPAGMPDPSARGESRERAEARLRWALACWLMGPRGGRVAADVARERGRRAEIYVADVAQPAA